MSVGGRGPTLFLFVLLCQFSITDVAIDTILLLLIFLLLLIDCSDKGDLDQDVVVDTILLLLLILNKLDRKGTYTVAHCQGFLTCVIISSGYRIQETGNLIYRFCQLLHGKGTSVLSRTSESEIQCPGDNNVAIQAAVQTAFHH